MRRAVHIALLLRIPAHGAELGPGHGSPARMLSALCSGQREGDACAFAPRIHLLLPTWLAAPSQSSGEAWCPERWAGLGRSGGPFRPYYEPCDTFLEGWGLWMALALRALGAL